MNYENYVLANWRIDTSSIANDSLLYLFSDGTYLVVSQEDTNIRYETLTLNDLMGQCANYYNRFLTDDNAVFVSVAYCFNKKDFLFMNTNRANYFVYGAPGSYSSVYGYKYTSSDSIDDLSSIDNYYTIGAYEPFTDFDDEHSNYGAYNMQLSNEYCVFDYTNIRYAQDDTEYFIARGENVTFYNYVTEMYISESSNANVLDISYGAPFFSIANSEYTRGYGNGYSAGWVNGQQYGYQQGQNSVISNETATAFSYVSQAFNAVGGILELEVLPHVNLGLCFSIPLILVLIMTIFKLVRK